MKRFVVLVLRSSFRFFTLVQLFDQWTLLFENLLPIISVNADLFQPLLENFLLLDFNVINRIGFVDVNPLQFANVSDDAQADVAFAVVSASFQLNER